MGNFKTEEVLWRTQIFYVEVRMEKQFKVSNTFSVITYDEDIIKNKIRDLK